MSYTIKGETARLHRVYFLLSCLNSSSVRGGYLGLDTPGQFSDGLYATTPLSLMLRRFFLPEKGRYILFCGFQFELVLPWFPCYCSIELCLFGMPSCAILGFQLFRAGLAWCRSSCLEIRLLPPGTLSSSARCCSSKAAGCLASFLLLCVLFLVLVLGCVLCIALVLCWPSMRTFVGLSTYCLVCRVYLVS